MQSCHVLYRQLSLVDCVLPLTCAPPPHAPVQGAVINQIKELLGVSIRISKKGEFLPGTYDRACSITGTPEVGPHWAWFLLYELVGCI